MFTTFDHTADVGVRLEAGSLAALLEQAGHALLSLLVENPADVRPVESVEIRLEGTDPEMLLFDWLGELLFTYDTTRLLLSRFDVTLDERGLVATARGERQDDRRHHPRYEVKAVTYHGLAAGAADGRWTGRVILDI
ncbi:MAG: archease [Planctomycetota bacterium]|jgi:SHS2 domain-containing protein